MIQHRDPAWTDNGTARRRAVRPHDCVVPYPDPTDVPQDWVCPSCGGHWLLAKGLHVGSRHWLRCHPGPGRVQALGWAHIDRHPARVAPQLTGYDLTRQSSAAALLDELGLSGENLAAVRFSNPSAHGPYHGYHHLLCVALNAVEGAQASGITGRDEMAVMLLAGLWHDFDHTLDADVDDSVNVARAVTGWYDLGRVVNATGLDDTGVDAVARLIGATRFPHTHSSRLDERILQDSDLLQVRVVDRRRFLDGIEAESGRPLSKHEAESFARRHGGQTAWARERLGAGA